MQGVQGAKIDPAHRKAAPLMVCAGCAGCAGVIYTRGKQFFIVSIKIFILARVYRENPAHPAQTAPLLVNTLHKTLHKTLHTLHTLHIKRRDLPIAITTVVVKAGSKRIDALAEPSGFGITGVHFISTRRE